MIKVIVRALEFNSRVKYGIIIREKATNKLINSLKIMLLPTCQLPIISEMLHLPGRMRIMIRKIRMTRENQPRLQEFREANKQFNYKKIKQLRYQLEEFLVKYSNSFPACNKINSSNQITFYKAHRKSYCLVIKI